MNQSRNEFFQQVVSSTADNYAERQQERDTRLEHTMLVEAIRVSGLGNNLQALIDECQSELQLDTETFKLDWFERRFPLFPVKLLTAEAWFSKEATLVDTMLAANKQPQFKAYTNAVVTNGIDDTEQAVCCVFRVGGRLQCVHNLLSHANPFANLSPDTSATALVWHSRTGLLCLQWYKQFLQSLGNEWAK